MLSTFFQFEPVILQGSHYDIIRILAPIQNCIPQNALPLEACPQIGFFRAGIKRKDVQFKPVQVQLVKGEIPAHFHRPAANALPSFRRMKDADAEVITAQVPVDFINLALANEFSRRI